MRPARPRLIALALPVVLLAAAACSKAAAPSQEQYASMADSVCESTGEKLTDLEEQYDVEKYEAAATGESTITLDRPERWMRVKIVPQYERMSSSLKGIPPPEGDGTYLSDLYADLDERIETLHRRPSDGRDVVRKDTLLQQRFRSYGMETCGTI
ncbi:MAG TPA: hypothetical protein VGO60_12975 [Iamia sp.]|nr:hypothetical protein [Iamia sp.]